MSRVVGTTGKRALPGRQTELNNWKKNLSQTLLDLNIITEHFNGKIVLSIKEGGIGYLEKTETWK